MNNTTITNRLCWGLVRPCLIPTSYECMPATYLRTFIHYGPVSFVINQFVRGCLAMGGRHTRFAAVRYRKSEIFVLSKHTHERFTLCRQICNLALHSEISGCMWYKLYMHIAEVTKKKRYALEWNQLSSHAFR